MFPVTVGNTGGGRVCSGLQWVILEGGGECSLVPVGNTDGGRECSQLQWVILEGGRECSRLQ